MAVRVEDFVAWVNNEATMLGLPDEVIAPDPHGRLGATRFKRTLVWHIARRPCRLPAAGRLDEVASWSGPSRARQVGGHISWPPTRNLGLAPRVVSDVSSSQIVRG